MLILLLISLAAAQTAKIKIYTSNWPPMVTCTQGDTDITKMKGFEIELFQAIVATYHIDYEIECTDWDTMMEAIKTGENVMGLGGITIYHDRLKFIQFSNPTFDSGLVLMVTEKDQSFFWLFLEPFDWTLWICILFTGIFQAHIIWILERRADDNIPMKYKTGILEAIYFTYASMFFMGNKKIRTIPGRIMQISFWFMSYVLLAAYVGDLASRLSVHQDQNSIKTYEDIDGKTVGTYEEFETVVSKYGADVETYEWNSNGELKMIDDLKDGKLDAIVIEYPAANYYNSGDCDLRIQGDIFVPLYYAYAFSLNFDDNTIKTISVANALLYQNYYQRNLKNIYTLVTDEKACDFSLGKPIEVYQACGLAVTLGMGYMIALPCFHFYKRKYNTVDEEEDDDFGIETDTEKSDPVSNKFDSRTAAETDLISKFENILSISQAKFAQKMKDLESALSQHTEGATQFEDTLKDLSSKLDISQN